MPEQLPPLSFKDLETALGNPGFSVYVYNGKEKDEGWQVALDAHDLIPALRVYLVKDRELCPTFYKDKAANVRVVVFGYTKEPHCFLTKTESEDLKIVIRAINAAREATT